jgi:hypothetical protein
MLGLGPGYRPYEFAGFGRDFAARHDRQEEALALILELLHTRRTTHQGPYFQATIAGKYEVFPVSVQQPHPPLFIAAGTDRSLAYAARHGFGLMLSTLPSFETLARQVRFYREHVQEARVPLDQNPACGNVDVARWVYVAETDAAAKRDTEAGIVRHISHFLSAATLGYLGTVSEKQRMDTRDYDTLAATTLVHGSPDTVIARLRALRRPDRADLAPAPLSALLWAREDHAEPATLCRACDASLSAAARGGGVTRTLSVAAPMFILNLQMHRARLEAALPDRHIIQEGPHAFVEFEHPTTRWEALNALITGLTPLMQPEYGWVRRRVPRPIP